jgi:hypothetical protein
MSEQAPSPSRSASTHVVGSPSHASSPLNPQATPFSLSYSTVFGDLPEWLLFSPSSSEGRSGRCVTALPASFTEVVCHGSGAQLEAASSLACPRPLPSMSEAGSHCEGKAPVEDADTSGPHHDEKALAGPSFEVRAMVEHCGFMADANICFFVVIHNSLLSVASRSICSTWAHSMVALASASESHAWRAMASYPAAVERTLKQPSASVQAVRWPVKISVAWALALASSRWCARNWWRLSSVTSRREAREGGGRGIIARSGDAARAWQRSGGTARAWQRSGGDESDVGMHPHIPILIASVWRLATSPTELCAGQGRGRQRW